MKSTVPTKASEYTLWLANFNQVAGANMNTLGLTQVDVGNLTASAGNVNTAIANAVAAEASTKAVVKTKQNTLHASEKLLRAYAKKIQANPAIPDALRKQLGLPVRQPATHTPPIVPLALTVSGQADGTNTLAWNTMGNKQGTMYLIEYQNTANGGWTLLDTTTRAKYAATGFIPGQRTSYRVRAKRSEQTSTYSNEAVIYGNL